MIIGLAQIAPRRADTEGNIEDHVDVILEAGRRGCQLVLFPEMSLTGYETFAARSLASSLDDSCWERLQGACDASGVYAAVGAPLSSQEGVQIAQVLLRPGATRQIYRKQHLHANELPFFVPGDQALDIQLGEHRLALAICYESTLERHVDAALARGATAYLASVAKSEEGIRRASEHYAALAREHELFVLVSNSVGPSDGFVSAGSSAAWSPGGELVCRAGAQAQQLLVVELQAT